MDTKSANWSTLHFTPALLIVVACLQLFLATTQGLTPWKGGGFGMFSTVDSGAARFTRIYLIEHGKETAVIMPNTAAYERLGTQMRHFPRQELLERMARNLAGEIWVRTEYSSFELPALPISAKGPLSYRVAHPDEPVPASAAVAIQAVRVELWRYHFDGQTGVLSAHKLMEHTQANG